MKKFLATMLVVGLMAVVAQAGAVHYNFNETVSGTWEVNVTVTGADTSGLSAYGVWVYGGAATVTYAENVLGTIGAGFQAIGFQSLVAGPIGVDYNAGNFQSSTAEIPGIGMVPVDDPGIMPGTTPHVLLGVPALVGTITTPGLNFASYVDEFAPDGAGLLNLAGDGFLTAVEITYDVTPEPMTLSLLAIGGLLVALKRKRS